MKPLITSILLAIMILLLFAVYGCGTRKTDTQIKDSIHVENNYSQGTKIVLGNTFTYKPFDALKPMIIEGKKYENAIVSNDKIIVKTNWNTRFIKENETVYRTKLTKKTDNTILHIGLFLVLIIGILAWFKLPSFRKGI